jgi:hypothetical protein
MVRPAQLYPGGASRLSLFQEGPGAAAVFWWAGTPAAGTAGVGAPEPHVQDLLNPDVVAPPVHEVVVVDEALSQAEPEVGQVDMGTVDGIQLSSVLTRPPPRCSTRAATPASTPPAPARLPLPPSERADLPPVPLPARIAGESRPAGRPDYLLVISPPPLEPVPCDFSCNYNEALPTKVVRSRPRHIGTVRRRDVVGGSSRRTNVPDSCRKEDAGPAAPARAGRSGASRPRGTCRSPGAGSWPRTP